MNFDVFLVDDGSTDNTSKDVSKLYPSVKIVKGDGSLFWNQGMILAWQTAELNYQCDAFLLLNDDTYLNDNSLNDIFSTYSDYQKEFDQKVILVGACEHSYKSNTFTYGLRDFDWNEIEPNNQFTKGKYMNGNVVFITREIIQELGFLSDNYLHSYGDIDYGLRANHVGINLITTSKYIANCKINNNKNIWCDEGQKLSIRLKHFFSPKGLYLIDYIRFTKRFWPRTYLLRILKSILKLIFPRFYKTIKKRF